MNALNSSARLKEMLMKTQKSTSIPKDNCQETIEEQSEDDVNSSDSDYSPKLTTQKKPMNNMKMMSPINKTGITARMNTLKFSGSQAKMGAQFQPRKSITIRD